MSILLDKYVREVMDSSINLGLFNDGGAEGGDGDQGGSTQGTDGDTPQANKQVEADKGSKEKDGDDESKFKKFKEWLSSTGAESNNDSREANSGKKDKKDDESKGGQTDKNLDEVNERIAGIERREKLADLREAGVPKNMLDDAMALFESSGAKDINKFLETRSYLKGQTEQPKPEKKNPEDEPVKKTNLTAKEQHLKKMGYLK